MADLANVKKYLYDNKSFVLSTVDEAGNPQLRHIGGYTVDGLDILFQTGKETSKAKEIKKNDNVALLFQHEGQESLKNITLYGHAKALNEEEAKEAVNLIKERRPKINYDPNINVIFKVKTDSVKILDFASDEKTVVLKANQFE